MKVELPLLPLLLMPSAVTKERSCFFVHGHSFTDTERNRTAFRYCKKEMNETRHLDFPLQTITDCEDTAFFLIHVTISDITTFTNEYITKGFVRYDILILNEVDPYYQSSFLLIYFMALGIEPRTSHVLGKHPSSELHPQPRFNDSFVET